MFNNNPFLFFYPVLISAYAGRIAEVWNTNDAFGGYCGIVTEFDVRKERYDRYEVKTQVEWE